MQIEQIKALIDALNESDLKTLDIKDGDFKLSLSKNSPKSTANPIAVPTVVPQEVPVQVPSATSLPAPTEASSAPSSTVSGESVNAPMIGTFYEAASPNTPPFVKVGDTIKKGSVIGIIEAMKIMNEIEAEFDFKVIDVLVKNEQPVEFDTPLFKVEKL